MHTELFYSKPHQKAFVVLKHCRDFDEIMHCIQLFEIHKKIKLPVNDVEFRIVDQYQYAGMVVVAFPLHEMAILGDEEWIALTAENKHLLTPRIYKLNPE